jgi:uncharacterized protein YaiI (UPF0178 family)
VSEPTIWIDADGAPGPCKEIIYKASQRTKTPVIVVANHYQQTPRFRWIRFQLVSSGPDVADDFIAENCNAGDLVITSDIPLAARVVEAGGVVVRFRGEELDAANVAQRLQVRDLMDELRGSGVNTGGPPPFGPKDKQRFAGALDRWLAMAKRTTSSAE